MNAKEILQKLSIEEKIALCEGKDFWHTMDFSQYGLASVMMSDGPHGLRKQEAEADMIGINKSIPATSFPTAAATGCSWDTELLGKIGRAICEEASTNGVSLVLGPGLNIKRNPLCGRNFEYFSEDPYLSGKLAAGFVKEGQKTGVGCCLKHFAANSQEYKRFSSDSVMDERTLREIYLAGFEIAVKEGKPASVMCSYNKINGVHASDDKVLLTDILRTEWDFDGMVVTDWGAMNDRIAAFRAGCDLNMPGGSRYQQKKALQAVQKGELTEAEIDRCALRIIEFILRAQEMEETPCDMDAHHDLARQAAEQSAVLLKNDGALPVRGSACLIGNMAKEMRYQGAGSSHINPFQLVNPLDCMDWSWAQGCNADGSTTDALLQEAAELAKTVDTPVVIVGLTDSYESEGYDREHMKMPEGHVQLVEAVTTANPNTVVVLLSGSPVELPWLDNVNALLYMALPGQAGGEAIYNLLTGAANPSGKLAETWPIAYDDVVTKDFYGQRDAEYREGVFVGYRYYDRAKKQVRFPFGFGLSYTQFAYSNLAVDGDRVSVTIQNTGEIAGAEVVQLYIYPPQDSIARPIRELKGFTKVFLQPGEAIRVELTLNDRSFALWQDGWVVPSGTYGIEIGGLTAQTKKDGAQLPVPRWQSGAWYDTMEGTPSHKQWEAMLGRKFQSRQPEKGKFTMDNTVMEMKDHSFIMKCMFMGVEGTIAKSFGGKKDYTDPSFRMMMASAADSALRGMTICGGMNENLFEGLLEMANGHFIQGIRKIIKG